MPELPEVEFAKRTLAKWFRRHALLRVEADNTRIFRSGKRKDFLQLKGTLTAISRRGKYLMLSFGDRGLMAHLGMTGKFVKRRPGQNEPYSRARFVLENGDVIHFRDPRMFGEICAAPAKQLSELKAVKKLGVDPLVDGLTPQQLKKALGTTRVDLKVALMDQTRIAGLGNIHAAEALFRAKLHPGRKVDSLNDAELKSLTKAIHDSIQFALKSEGMDDEIEYVEEPGAENPFLIYGRAGSPCKKCGTKVKSFSQGGRTTHFCSKCQPERRKKI